MEDINVKFEADGQTITSNTEMVMVTFAIERLREIYDEESRLRTNLEQIERKLLASVQESSNRALEKFKADSGVVDLGDVNGSERPELSWTRGGRSNGRNNKQQYFEEEREFNEAFIPKVRKLAKALLKDVQWVHDEDSEEYKNMYATYDNFHKSHASGERIGETIFKSQRASLSENLRNGFCQKTASRIQSGRGNHPARWSATRERY